MLLLFLCFCAHSFAQAKKENSNMQSVIVLLKDTPSPNLPSGTQTVFKKTPLPLNQKVSPEIFYVLDDKPVDRQKYVDATANQGKK